jgi:hypothetical protein
MRRVRMRGEFDIVDVKSTPHRRGAVAGGVLCRVGAIS